MSDAAKAPDVEPLQLDAAWRISGRSGGATVHPLRVVAGDGRSASSDDELRTIVAEIVREELRSDLGRRITGSIRQLVRDEVSRILSRIARA